jgi:phosphopantothenate---cysteine ligase (CTP)
MNDLGATSRRFLVTAGNTREMIDAVRDWGNVFTGNTGFAIACALAEAKLGEVELLTSNAAHVDEAAKLRAAGASIGATKFQTHADLKSLLESRMRAAACGAVFMTAAVADYRPVRAYEVVEREAPRAGDEPGVERWVVRDVQAAKVKSSFKEIAILGEQTEKLVNLFRSTWNHRGLLVKFKLEVGVSTEQLLEIGRASRIASGADYLVANTLEMVRSDKPGAYLIDARGHEWVPRHELPGRMVALAQNVQTV